jgi:hypothetical protein
MLLLVFKKQMLHKLQHLKLTSTYQKRNQKQFYYKQLFKQVADLSTMQMHLKLY